jgi:hypothetical protein
VYSKEKPKQQTTPETGTKKPKTKPKSKLTKPNQQTTPETGTKKPKTKPKTKPKSKLTKPNQTKPNRKIVSTLP